MNHTSSHREQKDSREKLLAAARKVFAHRGYDGATVKELADEAGVNISLVSYHFGGKEGLYKACIEEAGRDRLAMAERIMKAPESYEDFRVRLTLFIEEFFNFNLGEKEVCTILNREFFSGMQITREVFQNTFLKAHEKLFDFFRSAQQTGIMRKDVDPQLVTMLFFGALHSAVQWDCLSKDFYDRTLEDRAFRDQVIQHSVDHLIAGFVEPGLRPGSQHPERRASTHRTHK